MYAIADDLDFSFLSGSLVTAVKEFAPCDPRPNAKAHVIISLEPRREVHIEGGRRLVGPDTEMQELIGKSIIEAEVRSRTELVLHLSGGSCLHLFDDSTEYECFRIEPEFIVV